MHVASSAHPIGMVYMCTLLLFMGLSLFRSAYYWGIGPEVSHGTTWGWGERKDLYWPRSFECDHTLFYGSTWFEIGVPMKN